MSLFSSLVVLLLFTQIASTSTNSEDEQQQVPDNETNFGGLDGNAGFALIAMLKAISVFPLNQELGKQLLQKAEKNMYYPKYKKEGTDVNHLTDILKDVPENKDWKPVQDFSPIIYVRMLKDAAENNKIQDETLKNKVAEYIKSVFDLEELAKLEDIHGYEIEKNKEKIQKYEMIGNEDNKSEENPEEIENAKNAIETVKKQVQESEEQIKKCQELYEKYQEEAVREKEEIEAYNPKEYDNFKDGWEEFAKKLGIEPNKAVEAAKGMYQAIEYRLKTAKNKNLKEDENKIPEMLYKKEFNDHLLLIKGGIDHFAFMMGEIAETGERKLKLNVI